MAVCVTVLGCFKIFEYSVAENFCEDLEYN